MSRRRTKRSNASPPRKRGGFAPWLRPITGLLLVIIGVVGAAASVNSLAWQIQTRWSYSAGTCRVVSARVVQVGHGYELDIAHQVEVDGRAYRPTRNTDQSPPAYASRAEAEAALASFSIGSVHRCWYDAQHPDLHSLLIHRDMDPWTQSGVLVVSLVAAVAGAGLLLMKRNSRSVN
ncbi:MAG: hypothetical protein RIC55_08480 [Pirellulaceae bacterium]